jgi:lipopolysaccharide export system permease protein
MRDLYVFDFDQRRLRTFTYAEGAAWDEKGWTLHDLVEEQIVADGAVIRRAPVERLETRLGPRQLGVLFLPVENLSILDLVQTAESLRERGEDARIYDYAFWRRTAMPLVAAVMLLAAIPLVLDVRPRLPLGQRAVVGALAGIGFQMLNDTFSRFGLGYGIQPIVTALLPAVLVLTLALWRSLSGEGRSA